MLTERQYNELPIPIMELFERFEQSIINDIARRLVGMDYAKATAAWQVQRLSESGLLYDEILQRVSEIDGRSVEVLRKVFDDAGVQALAFDDEVYRRAGLNPLPLNLSPQMALLLADGVTKTNGLMRNLIGTTAASGQDAFIAAADMAYLQVSTGAMSYTQAIREGIKSLAGKGLDVIQFSGRRDQLDVAVRRSVLTGVSQTVGRMQVARADEMGCDLVEVTAHVGARNVGSGPKNHESWQGKVYSRSGTDRQYKPFVETTGYGTGEGLNGWNCRHSFFPFFEGISERVYSEKTLSDYSSKTVTYNGEELDYYRASQVQRSIERDIRAAKRQAGALEAAGLDSTVERRAVAVHQARMRDFVEQTGLIRQREREQVVGVGRGPVSTKSQPRPTTPKSPPLAEPIPAVEPEVPAQPALPEFVQAKSIKQANNYAVETLGLDWADYKGADIETANAWNEGLHGAFSKFPELRNLINSTGTCQARYTREIDSVVKEILEKSAKLLDQFGFSEERKLQYAQSAARKRVKKTPQYVLAYSANGSWFNSNGIFVNSVRGFEEIAGAMKDCVRTGFHPEGTGSVKAVIDHELAHQIDALLDLKHNKDILALYNDLGRLKITEELSEYATSSVGEFIAEAWSEFTNNPNPREIAQQVGDIIRKAYLEFKKNAN